MSVIAQSISKYKRCTDGRELASRILYVLSGNSRSKRSLHHICIMYLRTIFLLNLLAMVLAADKPIAIVSQSQDISPDGSFFSKWETANGIVVEEEGVLKNRGQKDAEAEEVRGSASWTAPDGTRINLGWLANENGASFQGAHLPTPPPTQPIPILIQRALDWIAANPSRDEKNRL